MTLVAQSLIDEAVGMQKENRKKTIKDSISELIHGNHTSTCTEAHGPEYTGSHAHVCTHAATSQSNLLLFLMICAGTRKGDE